MIGVQHFAIARACVQALISGPTRPPRCEGRQPAAGNPVVSHVFPQNDELGRCAISAHDFAVASFSFERT
jgi:hypothetical protein